MLEKWRIWRRINWKQFSKKNTEISETFWVLEQVRDEDVSIMKEKKRANVATSRRTKPIVASVLQYCSKCKIGILQAMDPTHKPMMDLAQSLQTWCVRAQNWYEHVASSICADEEELTVAERSSWYSDAYPETGTGTETETDSCQ